MASMRDPINLSIGNLSIGNLSIGQPRYDPPPELAEAACEPIRDGHELATSCC